MFETGSLEWILLIVLLPVVGVIIGWVAASILGSSHRILLIRERDRRGKQYGIKKEDHIKLISKGNPPIRIYKYRGAYEFLGKAGKKITTFFAKEGTAYNMALESGEKEVKNANFGEIAEIIWGEEFYKTVPEDRRKQLETNKLTMTVDIEQGITPTGYAPITEVNIASDGDENMAAAVAKGVTKGMAIPWINYVFSIGCGAGLTFVACLLMGWIKLAG